MSAPQNLGEALDALAPFLPEGVDFTLTHYGAYPSLLGRAYIGLSIDQGGGRKGPEGDDTGLLSAMPLSHRLELAQEQFALSAIRLAERDAKARAECAAKAAAVDMLAVGRKIMDHIEAGQASPLPDVLIGELSLVLTDAKVGA